MKQAFDSLVMRSVAVAPWTNVYGLGRSLLALSTLLTLSFTDADVLFGPAMGTGEAPTCIGAAESVGLFCLLRAQPALATWLAIAILLVVVAGWRPRLTGLPHWWVSYSLVHGTVLVDGGDHVNMVLSLLLVPLTFTDDRRWHWSPARPADPSSSENVRRLIGRSSHWILRLQVAVIYLHAAFAKCAVAEWQDGTAIYYWLTDPQYGVAEWLRPAVLPILATPLVAPVTWGVIVLEFALFAAILAERQHLRVLLRLGILLHAAIAVLHGLVTFSIAMAGALVLYLRPLDDPFGARATARSRPEPDQPPLPLPPEPSPRA